MPVCSLHTTCVKKADFLRVVNNVPIGASTGQHLVDAKDVERVHTNPQVEGVFASGLCHILVGTNTGSLQCLAGKLLILVRHKVTAERELVDRSTLPAEIKDTNLEGKKRVSSPAAGAKLTMNAP
jgi:hypothetical protein